jgi:hypothetical protein
VDHGLTLEYIVARMKRRAIGLFVVCAGFVGAIVVGCGGEATSNAPSGSVESVSSVQSAASAGTPIQVYGTWSCGSDYCTWGSVRDMTDFDAKNHWLIDRGDGVPSVNLVVLSFVDPVKLLNLTTDSSYTQGIPNGMTANVVNYFTSKGVRVMLSVGGITFVSNWDSVLSSNPTQLAINAAHAAAQLGVGIEIDYEQSTTPQLDALATFISTYRGLEPYDATGANPAARLTIDLGAGDRYLSGLAQRATSDWLSTTTPVLDYANAMVPNKQPTAASAEANWQEHIDGEPRYAPPIAPLAPAKFTGAFYLVNGRKAIPECNSFSASLESSTGSYVQTVAPNGAGVTPGMLGYMFWASECSSTTSVCTTPPNTCQGGVGAGAKAYGVPVPMPALRQN